MTKASTATSIDDGQDETAADQPEAVASNVNTVSKVKSASTKEKGQPDSAGEDTPGVESKLTSVDRENGFCGEKVSLKVSGSKDDAHPMFISINGYAYHFPRNQTVIVPIEVVQLLETCIERDYSADPRGVDVLRYNFSSSPVKV